MKENVDSLQKIYIKKKLNVLIRLKKYTDPWEENASVTDDKGDVMVEGVPLSHSGSG